MDTRTPRVKYVTASLGKPSCPLRPCLMLAHKYESAETLSGHTSSITVVLFSPDAEYLASGSENGVILVTATRSWEIVKKLVNVSPVTALLWDPTFPVTVVCGFASGAILTVHIGESDTVRLEPITTIVELQLILRTVQIRSQSLDGCV